MNPYSVITPATKDSIPRVSGDEPYLCYAIIGASMYSPRERG